MKEYNVGDTIYVKGKVKAIDDTTLPYCVDFVSSSSIGWVTSDNIIDELPTTEPVKPVLPKEVADELEYAKNHRHRNFYGYLRAASSDATSMDCPAATRFLDGFRGEKIKILSDAWYNGYTVETEKKYSVKVPKKWSGNDKYYWSKEQDGSLTWAFLVNKDYMISAQQFTLTDIEHYGLQDCEKVEVNDEDTK